MQWIAYSVLKEMSCVVSNVLHIQEDKRNFKTHQFLHRKEIGYTNIVKKCAGQYSEYIIMDKMLRN